MGDLPDNPPDQPLQQVISQPDDLREDSTQRARIRAGLMLAFTVFVLSSGLLYYRFLTVQQPTCSVWISGDESFDATVISVSVPGTDSPLQTTLQRGNRFAARFFANPCTAHVTIVEKDGNVLFDGEIDLYAGFPVRIDLKALRPQTRPA